MWCRLKDIFIDRAGLSYKKDNLLHKSDKMIRVLRGGNIIDGSYVIKDDDVMISSDFVDEKQFLRRNQIITPAVTSIEKIGKLSRIDIDQLNTVAGGFVLVLTPFVDYDELSVFISNFLQSPYAVKYMRTITKKSGQAFYNLSRPLLMNMLIPLPSSNNQIEINKQLSLFTQLL
ncbi:MAG: hypothetical protein Q4B70_17500 [Lachnospiraceae bacterium]|nr:hypothetical protein [Lachnospiraceae bacterium]